MTSTDSKITLVKYLLFIIILNTCKNLSTEELDALSDTASKFFHFVQALDNKLKLHNFEIYGW